MKIYLAGGFSVMTEIGRERELSQKMRSWKRLCSFYWRECLIKSDIIKIAEDENIFSNMASRRKSRNIPVQKKI